MMRESHRTTNTLSGLQQRISLINILTCKICNSKAKSANLCPNCSKFFCQNCIKIWLKTNKCCPSCYHHISEPALVNCQKLSEDLANALQALNQDDQNIEHKCEQHSQKVAYYCKDCRSSLCSDCIILSGKHTGHKFIKMKQAKSFFNQKILSTLTKIRNCKREVQKQKEQLVNQRIKADESRLQKIQLLRLHNQKVGRSYDCTYTQIIQKKQQNFNNLRTLIGIGNKTFDHFKHLLQTASKPKLVMLPVFDAEQKIQNSCQQIMNYQQIACSQYSIQNRILPEWSYRQFEIKNYSQLRQNNQIIYTQSFIDQELSWRLKIYTSGIENTEEYKQKINNVPLSPRTRNSLTRKQDYLSVYIELQSGLRNGCLFRHKVQILHPNDPQKIISHIYQSRFEIGEYWGYDNFTNISALYQYGYISPITDNLHLRLSIAPSNFYECCINSTQVLNKKQEQFFYNNQRINYLRQNIQKKSLVQSIFVQKPMIYQNMQYLNPNLDIQNTVISYPSDPELVSPSEKYLSKSLTKIDPIQFNFELYLLIKEEHYQQQRQQPDYQSNQLRKAYKRLRRSQSKNLLLF